MHMQTMKASCVAALLAAASMLVPTGGHAAGARTFSVRDFGAKGDGGVAPL